MRKLLPWLGLVALALTVAAAPAHASERIYLRNGFSFDCLRHEALGDQLRLYTSADSANYIDVSADHVIRIESIPDPAPKAEAAAAAPTPAQPAPAVLTDSELHPLLLSAGAEHRIDEDLLASIVQAESAGRVSAISHAGAQGLMQLMPSTAANLGVDDAFVPAQNIAGGAAYLDQMLTRYHDDLALALAAYNAGPAAVDRYHGVPPYPETRAYIRRVILAFNRRKLAASRPTLTASK